MRLRSLKKNKSGCVVALFRFVRRMFFYSVAATIVSIIAYAVGASTESNPDIAPTPAQQAESQTDPETREWPTLKAVGATNARIEDLTVRVGDEHDAARLLLTDPRRGVAVWRLQGEYFVHRVGSARPLRVGTLDDVRGLVEGAEPERQPDAGREPDEPGAAGSPEGDLASR